MAPHATGERDAAKTLKEAAEIMQSAPASLQLRFLQTLTSISAEKNSTILVPFPSELLSVIGGIGQVRSLAPSSLYAKISFFTACFRTPSPTLVCHCIPLFCEQNIDPFLHPFFLSVPPPRHDRVRHRLEFCLPSANQRMSETTGVRARGFFCEALKWKQT